jgi:CRP-like cAMP-binding protein
MVPLSLQEELSMCVRTLTVLPGDLIVRRGEPGAKEMFVVLKGTVKVFGYTMAKAHLINSTDTYPFFGIAEMLGETADEQIEHRSVVAMSMCCLARIDREDFDASVALFPKVREKLENVGQAELLDVLSLDEAYNKTDLKEQFDAMVAQQLTSTLASPKANAKRGMLTATSLQALVKLYGCSLSNKQVVAAMQIMDPQSRGGFNFEAFFKWWSSKTANTSTPIESLAADMQSNTSCRTSIRHSEEAIVRGSQTNGGMSSSMDPNRATKFQAHLSELTQRVNLVQQTSVRLAEAVEEMDERVKDSLSMQTRILRRLDSLCDTVGSLSPAAAKRSAGTGGAGKGR